MPALVYVMSGIERLVSNCYRLVNAISHHTLKTAFAIEEQEIAIKF